MAGADEPPPRAPVKEVHLERYVAPVVVDFAGSSGAIYDAALREVVIHGFEITFSDPHARVIKAERIAYDAITTAKLDKKRRDRWEELSREQQLIVIRQGDRLSRQFSRGGVTWHRRLRLAIAIGERATVTPVVEACTSFEGDLECGTARAELRESEEGLVALVAKALAGVEPHPAPKTPTTEM